MQRIETKTPGAGSGGSSTQTTVARLAALLVLVGRFLGALFERGAENVAKRGAGIGGTVLGDGFLLFRHFQSLDRDADLVRLAVKLGHARIDLLADRETFRALLGAIAGEFGPL